MKKLYAVKEMNQMYEDDDNDDYPRGHLEFSEIAEEREDIENNGHLSTIAGDPFPHERISESSL
jgi:hypothetical protein